MTKEEYIDLRNKTKDMVRNISKSCPTYTRVFLAGLINWLLIFIPIVVAAVAFYFVPERSQLEYYLKLILVALFVVGLQVAITIIFPGRTIGNFIFGFMLAYQTSGKQVTRSDFLDYRLHRVIEDVKHNDIYEIYDQIGDAYLRNIAMRKCGLIYVIPKKVQTVLENYKDFKPVFGSYEDVLFFEKIHKMTKNK